MSWIDKVSGVDFANMKAQEKEDYVFAVLGITKQQVAKLVAEFEAENGKSPNAIFISVESLGKMPIRLRKINLGTERKPVRLTVIPMDAKPDQFVISQQDPWKWGDLFYR